MIKKIIEYLKERKAKREFDKRQERYRDVVLNGV